MKNSRYLTMIMLIALLVIAIPMQAVAKENRWNMGEVVNTGKDNGYSGMLDSRPSLDRMIVDIIRNKINMVIVKDIL